MTVHSSPLGKQTTYVAHYDPGLLHPIPRALNRVELGIKEDVLPFAGIDIWNGYELSWLNERGKPQVAVAEFRIPCDSPNIIESKSFKLYLNSYNQTRFADWDQVRLWMERDLRAAAGASGLTVALYPLRNDALPVREIDAFCIDDLDVEIDAYQPEPGYLTVDSGEIVEETLISHLLKSNCPVTGQPDWASLAVHYRGPRINHAGLLRYVISFREYQDFHEHCVERVFCDLLHQCKPSHLSVYARYTRRGGLDINPYRTTDKTTETVANLRLVRQ
jgi:7-cyano-7-deazaguanine reductase